MNGYTNCGLSNIILPEKGMIPVRTLMNLKNVMLSEINQSQKVTYCAGMCETGDEDKESKKAACCMTSLIFNVQNSQVYRDRRINGCPRLRAKGWGGQGE